MKELLRNNLPDMERSIKLSSSKCTTMIFTQWWTLLNIDEIHEYRGKKSRQFMGTVAIAKQALAVVGASATPVLSILKVHSSCGLPGLPSHRCKCDRISLTSPTFFASPVALESQGKISSWHIIVWLLEHARQPLMKIAKKLWRHCRRQFKKVKWLMLPWMCWQWSKRRRTSSCATCNGAWVALSFDELLSLRKMKASWSPGSHPRRWLISSFACPTRNMTSLPTNCMWLVRKPSKALKSHLR